MMKPSDIVVALAPILSRVRRSDHWVKPKGGSPFRRDAKLTDALMLNHVTSVQSLGACPFERGASTLRLSCLDLDDHAGEADWNNDMVPAARRLIEAGALFGVQFIPFRSGGGRGIHLYAIWRDQQDGRSMRDYLRQIIKAAGLREGTKGGVKAGVVELFPKQDSVPLAGYGSMFVLPMSRESVPLSIETLREIDLYDVDWPDSDPVPVLPPVERALVVAQHVPAELQRVRSALAAIDPNTLDYGGAAGAIGWLEILFAVHSASQASAEGLGLILEWSSRYANFSEAETLKQWNAAKLRDGGITGATLFRYAGERCGWVDPEFSAGFDIVELDETSMGDVVERMGGVANTTATLATGRNGVESTVSNMLLAVSDPAMAGGVVRFDEFLCEIVIDPRGDGQYRAFTDADYVFLRQRLERVGFKTPGREIARDAVLGVAELNRMDSAAAWLLDEVPAWDGVPRVERFFSTYFGTDDSDYTRACGRYIWTAAAGRVLDPGCQADMVPVLVGAQGAGKSQAVKAMSPDPKFYCEVDLGKRDADQARVLRGKLIGEIAELKGLASKDIESIKALITRTHEEWTPKFREMNTVFARRLVMIGTTNQNEFLADETGHRRWLPLRVTQCQPALVARDRAQLWAEARTLWQLDGVDWRGAERLAGPQHEEHVIDDPWDGAIDRYMAGVERTSARDVLSHGIGVDLAQQDQRAFNRVARVLRRLGYARFKGRDDENRVAWLWASRATVRQFTAQEVR